MSRKGFDFNLEVENVKDDEKFNNEVMNKEEIKTNIIHINNIPKAQSRLKIGNERNIIIELDIRFNKLQKFMWKKFFNIEVEDVK